MYSQDHKWIMKPFLISHNSITHILYISYHDIIYVPVATYGHSPSIA
jgi:hypothetical protein